jgi:hypothetical protein
MNKIDQERFLRARASAEVEMQLDGGIGTLSEKLLHKTVKFYVDPCREHHEIEYLGAVADVKNEQGIFEIQTRQFSYLIPKLRKFLENNCVTVIYPIVSEKMIYWIDEHGAVSKPRKTSRTGRATDVLYEASALSGIIPNKNLIIRVMLIRAEEYRRLDGWDSSGKRGSSRAQLVPTELVNVIDLACERDYAQLLPPLPDGFTAKDFSRSLRLKGRRASYSLTLLRRIGVVEQIGKRGNAFLYRIND